MTALQLQNRVRLRAKFLPRWTPALWLPWLALAWVGIGCRVEPEAVRRESGESFDEGFHQVDLHIVAPSTAAPGTTMDAASWQARVLRLVGEAEQEVLMAARRFDDLLLAEALVTASRRGVRVRVVGDEDRRGDPGFVRLAEEAGITLTFGDGAMEWSPEPDRLILRTGDTNQMDNSSMVLDGVRFVVASEGFRDPAASPVQWTIEGRYEEMSRDLYDVVQQMAGGTFSTTLTLFGAPLSSDPNNRTLYPTRHEVWEFYVGPGEPLLKHVVDEIYGARASVWVVTTRLLHQELAEALRYKAEAGFDVRVWVTDDARNEDASLVASLESAFNDVRRPGQAWPAVYPVEGVGVTALLLDGEPSPIDGRSWRSQAMVLTSSLHHSRPFEFVTSEPRVSDMFTDALLFVIPTTPSGIHPNWARAAEFFRQLPQEVGR